MLLISKVITVICRVVINNLNWINRKKGISVADLLYDIFRLFLTLNEQHARGKACK